MKPLKSLSLMALMIWTIFVVLTWLDLMVTSRTETWALQYWILEFNSWQKYVLVPGGLSLWIFATGYVIGCWLMGWMRQRTDDAGGDLLAVALGMGAVSVITYLVGLAGGLLGIVFAVGGLMVCAAGFRHLGGLLHRLWQSVRGIPAWAWQDKVLLVVIIWYVVRTCLFVFNPATGWDECNSHLMAAKWYTREGVITFLPWVNFNNFPMGMECLLMLQFMGTQTPGSVIPYVFLLLTLCAIYQMVRVNYPIDWWYGLTQNQLLHMTGNDFKEREANAPRWIEKSFRTGALLACVVFLMVPAVTSYSQIVKPTMLLIFYAAMLAWAIITMPRKLTSYIVWGLLAGFLISMKYTGVLWAILMTVLVLFYGSPWQTPSRRSHIKWVLAYFGALLLVTSPWLIRNVVLFGSPLFPFFNDLVPAEWGTVAPALKAELVVKSSVMLKLFHVEQPWLAPWYNAMREDGPWAPHGRPGMSGPWLLALIPVVVVYWRSIPVGLRWVFVASCAYVTAWWWGWRLNETRYMMPALPGFCVAVGLGVAKLLEGNDD